MSVLANLQEKVYDSIKYVRFLFYFQLRTVIFQACYVVFPVLFYTKLLCQMRKIGRKPFP